MRLATPLAAEDGWARQPAKALFDRQRREPRDADGIVTAFRDGEVTLRSRRRVEGFTNAIKEIGYQGVRAGDLVIHSMDGFAGAIGVSDSDGKASPVVHCYRPRPGVDTRFYAYMVRDLALRGFVTALAKGIRERSTAFDAETFRSLVLPVPAPEEQRAIADYLDTETARIDALITKKRRMIELLEERLVERAEILTLGLDQPAVGPARTGYFTAVPAGWSQTSMRHLDCEVQTGPFGSQLHAEEYVEDGHPVVNPANLQGGEIVPLASMTISDAKRKELSRHILRLGDIVFGRRGEMGRAGLVEEQHVGWLCGTGSLRLRLSARSPLLPEYLKVLLETSALKNYFLLSSVGSTMDNLNSEILLELPALVPPKAIQTQIVESVAADRAHATELVDRLNRQLDKLAEHRQALITAAVTGELDIPEAA